jgi:ubiquinone/menaquinone biosynthesis C-methylase UbiE
MVQSRKEQLMNYKAKLAYRNKVTAVQYDKTRFHSIKGYLVDKLEKKLICRAIKKARLKPPAELLDLPCGTGRLSLFLAQKGFRVRGVDISEEMVQEAAKKMNEYSFHDQVALSVGDAESISFEDESFDLVVSLRLFGHLPPLVRKRVLAEMKRVARSFLIIVYYHKNSLQGLVRRKIRSQRNVSWHPVTFEEINNELKSIGLEKVRVFPLLVGVSETLVVLARKSKD